MSSKERQEARQRRARLMPVTALIGVDRAPDWVARLTTVPNPSYIDVFTLRTDVDASPEAWARAMFGDQATFGERVIWTALLGMPVARGASPDRVAGWPIALRNDEEVRLENESKGIRCDLIVRHHPGAVALASVIEGRREVRSAIWGQLSKVHRRLAPDLLRDAADKLGS